MGTWVKTNAMCFIDGRRYRSGDVFELPEGLTPARYMTVIKGSVPVKPKAAVKPKGSAPETLSEITAQLAVDLTPKGAEDLI
jgi:hypothetical protein